MTTGAVGGMSSPAKTHRRHLSGFSSNASSFSSRGSSSSSRYRERLSTTNSDARSSGSYLGDRDHLSLSQQPSTLSTFSNRSNLRTPCRDLVSAFSSQTSLQSSCMVKYSFSFQSQSDSRVSVVLPFNRLSVCVFSNINIISISKRH